MDYRGIDYVRYLRAHANNPRDPEAAEAWFTKRWGPMAAGIFKAAVNAIGYDDMTNDFYKARMEFFELVREASIVGSLPNSRYVPFNVPLLKMSSGANAYWVSQSKPIGLSKPVVQGSSLVRRTVGGIVAASKDVWRSDDLRIDGVIRNDLVRAVAAMLDHAFLSPGNAGDDATPGSPFNGVSAIASTGNLKTDLSLLAAAFGGDFKTSALISSPLIGFQLPLNGPVGIDAGPRGGTLAGIPFLTSASSPSDTSGEQIALIDAASLAVGLDDLEISLSDQATLLMSDDPENDSPPVRVSLFQEDLIAWKVVLRANWERQRTDSVAYITGADYSE